MLDKEPQSWDEANERRKQLKIEIRNIATEQREEHVRFSIRIRDLGRVLDEMNDEYAALGRWMSDNQMTGKKTAGYVPGLEDELLYSAMVVLEGDDTEKSLYDKIRKYLQHKKKLKTGNGDIDNLFGSE